MKFPILLMVTMGLTLAFAGTPVKEAKEIHQVAREARTAEQHTQVANDFKLRAEALEQKAQAHENKAANMSTGNAMAHKWPGLAQGPKNREIELAAKARTQAGEAREAAANHMKQAAMLGGIEAEP